MTRRHPLCIVHWGMPKTGSTSIQATLLAASPLPGATFLQVGTGNASRLLATLFMSDPGAFHLNRKWGLDARALAAERDRAAVLLQEQIDAAGDGPCILSGEVISSLDEDTLGRMRDWLEQRFDRLRLVGYVRAPRGYLESEFQQKIKAGRGRFRPERNYPGYAERFGRLEKVFGRERVEYWLFDTATFPQGDVVRDFLQRLDIRVPEQALQRSNESLGRDALSLLYIYRKHGPGYGTGQGSVEQNRRLQRALREVPGPRLRLANSLIEEILDAQAADIAWMEERLGRPLREAPRADLPGAIATEEDLLRPSSEAVRWLLQQLGSEHSVQEGAAVDCQTLADWMHALRLQLAPGRSRDASALVQQPRQAREGAGVVLDAAALLGPEADDAERMVAQAGLQALGRALQRSHDAGKTLQVEGLGCFTPAPRGPSGETPARMRFTLIDPTGHGGFDHDA